MKCICSAYKFVTRMKLVGRCIQKLEPEQNKQTSVCSRDLVQRGPSYMVATPLPSTSGTAASRLSEDTEVDNILPSVTPEDVSHIQPRPSDAYISDTQPFSHHQSPHHTSTSQPTWASTQPASSHLSATRASYPSGPGRRPKSGAEPAYAP